MKPEDLFAAFQLPAKAMVNRWIPKTALNEHVKSLTDRKLIDSMIERLVWVASLSPKTVGLVATCTALEVQLMALTARKEPNRKLLTAIHRAVPHPVLLATGWEGGSSLRLSLMSVHEGGIIPFLCDFDPSQPLTDEFVQSLALPGLPKTGAAALYDGLLERAEALVAAQISGSTFHLPASEAEARQRRKRIAAWYIAEKEWKSIRNAAKVEKRLARKVEYANQANISKQRLDELARLLGNM